MAKDTCHWRLVARHATGVCKHSKIPSGTSRQSRFGTRFAVRKENSLISFSSLSIFVSVVYANVYFSFCCHSSERLEGKCRAKKGKQFSHDGNYATETCIKLVCLIKENHWLHGKLYQCFTSVSTVNFKVVSVCNDTNVILIVNSNLYSNLLFMHFRCRTSKEGNLESPEMDPSVGEYWSNGSHQRVSWLHQIRALSFSKLWAL